MRGGQWAAPCAGHPLGVPPSSYKRHPSPSLSLTPPREGSLSPLEFIPHGIGQARYMFPVAIWQERVVLPLHRWREEARLLGASGVCASTDALLICGARTSSRS